MSLQAEVGTEKVAADGASKTPGAEVIKKAVWPTGKALAKTEQYAYAALLRQWGLPAPAKGQWPCQVARANGFRCLAKKSDLENILVLNRPAVLRMQNEQGQGFFGALVARQGSRVTIEVNGEPVRADLAELSKLWSGSFVMIWRPPTGYQGSIRPGHKGQVVAWLSEKLAAIESSGYTGERSKEVYGPEHVRAVKNIQRDNHLAPDGIAGKETLIVVNSLSGAQAPHLIKSSNNVLYP
jgi:general secretion pathway protein A